MYRFTRETYIIQEVHQTAEREDKKIKLLYQFPLSFGATSRAQILSELRSNCHIDLNFQFQKLLDY